MIHTQLVVLATRNNKSSNSDDDSSSLVVLSSNNNNSNNTGNSINKRKSNSTQAGMQSDWRGRRPINYVSNGDTALHHAEVADDGVSRGSTWNVGYMGILL